VTFTRQLFCSFATVAGLSVLGTSCAALPEKTVTVPAAGETAAVATANADAADDPAIWSAGPGRTAMLGGRQVDSFVLGTDKKAGLYAYGLDGKVLQFLPDGLLNNVDLREGFSGGQVLIGASDRGRMGTALYLFDPASTDETNALKPWGVLPSDLAEPYGFCMGKRGDAFLAVLIGKDGEVRQYRIEDDNGQAKATLERRFAVGSQAEGCAIDDVAGRLYIGEEAKGVWRYGVATNDDAKARVLLAPMDSKRLVADVEGVTVIHDKDATFLVVSSQGDSAFAVWRIDGEPDYKGRFHIGPGGGADGVSGTDGVAALGGTVGPFAEGLLVAQDDENEGAPQNFKFVNWSEVRKALGL
jgi:3-phytase